MHFLMWFEYRLGWWEKKDLHCIPKPSCSFSNKIPFPLFLWSFWRNSMGSNDLVHNKKKLVNQWTSLMGWGWPSESEKVRKTQPKTFPIEKRCNSELFIGAMWAPLKNWKHCKKGANLRRHQRDGIIDCRLKGCILWRQKTTVAWNRSMGMTAIHDSLKYWFAKSPFLLNSIDGSWPDPTQTCFWSVNKRPTRLWPGYFLAKPEEIFFEPKWKNWKI